MQTTVKAHKRVRKGKKGNTVHSVKEHKRKNKVRSISNWTARYIFAPEHLQLAKGDPTDSKTNALRYAIKGGRNYNVFNEAMSPLSKKVSSRSGQVKYLKKLAKMKAERDKSRM